MNLLEQLLSQMEAVPGQPDLIQGEIPEVFAKIHGSLAPEGMPVQENVFAEFAQFTENTFLPDSPAPSVFQEFEALTGTQDFLLKEPLPQPQAIDPLSRPVPEFDGSQTVEMIDGRVFRLDQMMVPTYERFDPSKCTHIVGDPAKAMEFWRMQNTDYDCAVCAQEFTLETKMGADIPDGSLRELSEKMGWTISEGNNSGTSMEDIGKVLEYSGMDVSRTYDNTLQDLWDALEAGNTPIVGVDAKELWRGVDTEGTDLRREKWYHFFRPAYDSNHAIQVIGMDATDPFDMKVIVNDSGVGNGCGAVVSADLFMKAWADSQFFMVNAEF